jgi:hypothetical protein
LQKPQLNLPRTILSQTKQRSLPLLKKKKKIAINPTKIKNKINFPEPFTNKNTKHSNQSYHQKTQTRTKPPTTKLQNTKTKQNK